MFPHSHKAEIQSSSGYINCLALIHLSGKLPIGKCRRQSETLNRNLSNFRMWKTNIYFNINSLHIKMINEERSFFCNLFAKASVCYSYSRLPRHFFFLNHVSNVSFINLKTFDSHIKMPIRYISSIVNQFFAQALLYKIYSILTLRH